MRTRTPQLMVCLIAGLTMMALLPGSSSLWAQSKVGTTSAPFLGIAVGARALGMGGAFTATADDASGLYWNPSGIATADRFQMNLVHSTWLADLKFNVVGAALPLKDLGVLGAQVTLLNIPDQEVTTTVQGEQDGTGIFYSAGSMAMQLSFARALTDRFRFGISAKYIHEWIYHESASTMAVDVGSLYTTAFHDLRIGFAICNFGGDMAMSGRDLVHYHDMDPTRDGNNDRILSEWNTDAWPLPMVVRLGLAMEPIHTKTHRLTTAVDAIHPNDNYESLNAGIEYAYQEQFMIRAGRKALFLRDTEEGFTLGAGLRISTRGGPIFAVDWAYEDFGRFNGVYKYSLGIVY